ncbi:MAG TPA: BMP family ABC transporter substrate-binding protein [Gaiellaceae bacterium]|nr:BMP family ABC transporter substrate-binding protein [Gaiellaceae bacterium]
MTGKRFLLRLAALLAITALVLAAGAAARTGRAGGPAAKQATVKVALVTDIGGLNDRGFNHLSYVGLQRAKKKLKVQTRVYITQTANDRTPNLRAAAQQGYGLVIPVGVLFAFGPIDAVAPAFSSTKFAGVDVQWSTLQSKPQNVRGIQFKEQEAGYLVGYIAGLVIKRHPYKGKQVVSGVGANKVPAITRFLAGYRAGAKKANRKVTVLINYANDPTFADQAKCKETTLNQIDRGSGVAFEAAGACGLGGLHAAKERGAWGIGVDADQGFLGKHILTSATKNVALSVYQAIAAYKKSPSGFKGGFDKVYSVKNNGVGYGKLSSKLSKADRTFITKKVAVIKKQIASGKIKPPSQ